MPTQPVLETSRLRLRPATADDLDDLWQLWTLPDVRRYLLDDKTLDREQARAVLADAAALAPKGLGLWTLSQRDDGGGLIGCAGLRPVGTAADYYPPLEGAIEPVVAIEPTCWRRGYAIESLTALIAYAVATMGISRLAGVTDLPNAASQRLLERLGFHLVAETDGPRYRLRHYALDRRTPPQRR
jgi:RimJ/RimL family protein N-acetyltransferase